MRRFLVAIILCCSAFIFYHCRHTAEPLQQYDGISGISETGPTGPDDFTGTLDLNDWDPVSYAHLTIRQNFWINKALTDTLSIYGGSVVPLKFHNLSQDVLRLVITVPPPFRCSSDSISIQSGQTQTLNLTADTTAVGNDTLIGRSMTLSVMNNEQLHYTLCWIKPRPPGGGVVVSLLPWKDCLYPAYPNPANGYFSLSFSISTDRFVLFYILNDKFEPVDTLACEYKKAGTYQYNALTTPDQKARLQAGYYRVVLQTDAYSRYGDIEFIKE